MTIVNSFLRKNKSGKRSKVKGHSRSKKVLGVALGGASLLGLGIGAKKLLGKNSKTVIPSPYKKISLKDKLFNRVDEALGKKLRNSPELLSDIELGKSAREEILKQLRNRFRL